MRMAYRRRKSAFWAFLLSLIWPGIGQIYAGRFIRGFLFVVVQAAIIGFSGLPAALLHMFNQTSGAELAVDQRLLVGAGVILLYNLYDVLRLVARLNRPRYTERFY
ncbi:MAG TPA: hypothetical protein GXX30_11575 [Firmicutes bacterium]|nr:hypothetical protein [Candidatus Fermentithermobacillaceae bacterium]